MIEIKLAQNVEQAAIFVMKQTASIALQNIFTHLSCQSSFAS